MQIAFILILLTQSAKFNFYHYGALNFEEILMFL